MKPPEEIMLKEKGLPVCILFFASLLAGCDGPQGTYESLNLSGSTMGTRYSVVGFASPGVSVHELHAEIDALLEAIDDKMSTYRAQSELSRFNRHQGTDWFEVSSETAFVIEQALAVSRASGGAFDVTVQPLVALWGFDSQKRRPDIPPEGEIRSTRTHVGFEKIAVRMTPPAIRKDDPAVQIDLSGIAKGYAVDRLAELLYRAGIEAYLVEIGGELSARGKKPDGSPWKVAIERPLTSGRSVQGIVKLENAAIATSGDYRNYFETDSRRHSHILDPRDGRSASSTLASVTIIAEDAIYADAIATAIMVLGPSVGFEFAVEHDLAGLFLLRSGAGLEERVTPRFEPHLLAMD